MLIKSEVRRSTFKAKLPFAHSNLYSTDLFCGTNQKKNGNSLELNPSAVKKLFDVIEHKKSYRVPDPFSPRRFFLQLPARSRRILFAIGNRNPDETAARAAADEIDSVPESRPPPRVTSLSGNAAFAEYLSPPRQLSRARGTQRPRLPRSQTVPAVPTAPRPAVQRAEDFSAGRTPENRKNGSSDISDVAEKDISVRRDCRKCLESERITSDVDYCDDRADYLIGGSVSAGLPRCCCDRECCGCRVVVVVGGGSVLPEKMATADAEPRFVNKAVRTSGINISKLRKFFDSGSTSATDSSDKSRPGSSSLSKEPSEDQEVLEHDQSPDSGVVRMSSDSSKDMNVPTVNGDLWKNVDIGSNPTSEGLWGSSQNCDPDFSPDFDSNSNVNASISSTSDLHSLISTSKARLSDSNDLSVTDRSNLENYFTSFDSNKTNNSVPLSVMQQSLFDSDYMFDQDSYMNAVSSSYDCDIQGISFDDDCALSDASSDEDMHCNPPIQCNPHYIPTYSLHTIIEESCEESEHESKKDTPTASKLERYFSWDIINDSDIDLKKKDDDNTSMYSDSLSEASGSLNGDMKELESSPLSSSRLEKYFTSGLIGNDAYVYPDDAEFIEDGPVSDFEEDGVHQKISRSALLSSLETLIDPPKSSENAADNSEEEAEPMQKEESLNGGSVVNLVEESREIGMDDNEIENDALHVGEAKFDENVLNSVLESDFKDDQIENTETKSDTCVPKEESGLEHVPVEAVENPSPADDEFPQKQTISKEQLASDVQAIIKKLLTYFSGSSSNSFSQNKESDYVSAWTILETEIERLIQSISPMALLENNSCSNSTIDSNNSDYGSDTIESLDCMTDDDESSDGKNRSNAKYPFVDIFSSSYKSPQTHELHNFHISDETLSIWKRLIHSLQKDKFAMGEKLYDPNSEARLYIRDQIVNLMHTVAVNENRTGDIVDEHRGKTIENILDSPTTPTYSKEFSHVLDIDEKDIEPSLVKEGSDLKEINEAYNVGIGNSGVLNCLSEEDIIPTKVEPLVETELSIEKPDAQVSLDTNLSVEETLPKSVEVVVVTNNAEETIVDDIPAETEKIDKLKSESSDNVLSIEVEHSDSEASFSVSEAIVDNTLKSLTNPPVESEVLPKSTKQYSDSKLNVDEVDLKLNCKAKFSESRNFSVVEIELSDPVTSVPKHDSVNERRSSAPMWLPSDPDPKDRDDDVIEDAIDYSHFSLPNEAANDPSNTDAKTETKSKRDTGYYSFKSSDDSLLNPTPPPDEFMDVPNFTSLKRSVKKFSLANTLSRSTNNINQVLSVPDTKFSTLQLKGHKSKTESSPSGSQSRQFSSLFSPSAVFRKLTGSKNPESPSAESSIPQKYLKKYARSSSVESDAIAGALSMPQLNAPRGSDSYSALGLYSENDRDSSLMDEDTDPHKYSRSVLSLGAHSVSMTSVYSAAGCHYGFVTVSGDALFGLNYNQKSQMMEVFVKQCRNLAVADSKRNKSDPYVKVYLLPDKSKSGKRKTKTKKNTCNPVFNELLKFPVSKNELESRTLWLSVWSSDLFGRNDFLGEISLPLSYRLLDSPTLRWYPLQERTESLTSPLSYKGELFLALKYVPRDLSLESRFRPAPVISVRGALHVLVKEARNISANGSSGSFDAFCKSYLLPDKSKTSKQKTPVVRRSRHPKWYYTMIYEDVSVDELRERSLELTVWDHDKLTSNEFMGGLRLNVGNGLYHGVPVDWMDSRKDESSLWEAMLQSPNMWVDGSLPLRPTMQLHHS